MRERYIMKKIEYLLIAVLFIFNLASCDNGSSDWSGEQGYLEAQGKWANVGKGSLEFALNSNGGTLVSELKTEYIQTYVGAKALTVKSINRLSDTNFTIEFSGTITDTTVDGIILSSKAIVNGAKNYLSVFLVTDNVIYKTSSRETTDNDLYTLDTTLGLYNGANCVESAITSTNIVATSKDSAFPITLVTLDLSYLSSSEIRVKASTLKINTAHFTIDLASATNSFSATYSFNF